jgi:hypothetical protein
VDFGLDTRTCEFGVKYDQEFSDVQEDGFYKITFAGELPVVADAMTVSILGEDGFCSYPLPGPNCNMCFGVDNETPSTQAPAMSALAATSPPAVATDSPSVRKIPPPVVEPTPKPSQPGPDMSASESPALAVRMTPNPVIENTPAPLSLTSEPTGPLTPIPTVAVAPVHVDNFPLMSPVEIPEVVPTGLHCRDVPDSFEFFVSDAYPDQNCPWVAENLELVQETFCTSLQVGWYACPETCGRCSLSNPLLGRSSIPTLACEDSTVFRFLVDYNYMEQGCDFIKDHIDFRDELCEEGKPAYFACAFSCGRCIR